jgi:hypothetical protein
MREMQFPTGVKVKSADFWMWLRIIREIHISVSEALLGSVFRLIE